MNELINVSCLQNQLVLSFTLYAVNQKELEKLTTLLWRTQHQRFLKNANLSVSTKRLDIPDLNTASHLVLSLLNALVIVAISTTILTFSTTSPLRIQFLEKFHSGNHLSVEASAIRISSQEMNTHIA